MRFKTGELVKDKELPTSTTLDASSGPFIAVRHRAFTSPSVYFGPFATLDDLFAWADEHKLAVGVISLTDPSSDESTWWNREI